jgi:ketosteroid isomerase-like protein
MRFAPVVLLLFLPLLPRAQEPFQENPREQVVAAERAFARSMAERNLQAFERLVAEDAIFFSDGGVLRGRAAVIEGWRQFFAGESAPFSWDPDQVEVLESGSLALSTGPVMDPTGRCIGRFNSVWRRDDGGTWLVVFDKGGGDCAPAAQ